MKSRKLEELTAALNQIRSQPTSELGLATLRQILQSKPSIVVAQAAELIGEFEIDTLIPELVTAFDRFLLKPKDSDPGCRAKQAIVETLYRLNYSNEDLFLKGIHHIQKEPVWGGQVDTASRLRGTSALGLVRMNYPLVMVELADLLADPETETRIGAVRAIAYTGNDQGVPLLRMRIRVGDSPAVLAESVLGLLQLAPEQSLPLVKELLYARRKNGLEEEVETAEAIALAVSESRRPEAFSILRDWWQQVKDPDLRQSGLLAIATLRQSEALEFLIALIATGKPIEAQAAIKAVSIYREDQVFWERVSQAIEQRQDLGHLPQSLKNSLR